MQLPHMVLQEPCTLMLVLPPVSYQVIIQQDVTSITCCPPVNQAINRWNSQFERVLPMLPCILQRSIFTSRKLHCVRSGPLSSKPRRACFPQHSSFADPSFPSTRTMDYGDMSGWTSDQFSLHYELPLNPRPSSCLASLSSLPSTCSAFCLITSDITTSITSYASGFRILKYRQLPLLTSLLLTSKSYIRPHPTLQSLYNNQTNRNP